MIYRKARLKVGRIVGAGIFALLAAASAGAGVAIFLTDQSQDVARLRYRVRSLKRELAQVQLDQAKTTLQTVMVNGQDAENETLNELILSFQNGQTVAIQDALDSNVNTIFFNEEVEAVPTPFLGVSNGGEPEDGTPGVLIGSIIDNSGAEAAGLQAGDIIQSFKGQSISSFAELAQAIQHESAIDEVVTISVLRDGSPLLILAVLGDRP